MPGIGIMANGSRRWLGMGPVQLQPAEFARAVGLELDLATRRVTALDARTAGYSLIGFEDTR